MYDTKFIRTYRRAITRARDEADAAAHEKASEAGRKVDRDSRLVSRFHPHQLRHTAATLLRARFGIETAQTVLGHATLSATQIYAEKDLKLAAKVAAEVG